MPRSLLVLLAGVAFAWPGPVEARPSAVQEPTEYVVVEGDTLWSLARRLLGDPQRWTELLAANRDAIPRPEALEAGTVLIVPPREVRRTDEEPGQVGPARVATIAVQAGAAVPATDSAAPVPARRPPAAGDSSRPAVEPVEAPVPAPATPPVAPSPPTPVFRDARLGPARDPAPAAEPRPAAPAVPAAVHASAPFLLEGAAADSISGSAIGQARWTEVRSARRGDRLVVVGGGEGLPAGARLQAYRLGRRLTGLGVVALPTGLLRVESVEDGAAVVVVERQFDRLGRGDRVHRLPDAPSQTPSETVPASLDLVTTLRGFAVDQPVAGIGDWVFLDAGATEGVRPGDEFVLAAPSDALRPGGRLQVVLVQGRSATARIVTVGPYLFEPGLEVRLDRRLR